MKRNFHLLICLFLLTLISVVCVHRGKISYAVKHTFKYENQISAGEAGVLFVNGKQIDSVDVSYFGIQRVPNGDLVYHEYRSESGREPIGLGEDVLYGSLGSYIYYADGRKQPLAEFLPYFDDWFSSPNVIDSSLCYWGLNKIDRREGGLKLYAMRYRFNEQQLDSLFLGEARIATDNPGYFWKPIKKNGSLRFHSESVKWWVDSSFESKEAVAYPSH